MFLRSPAAAPGAAAPPRPALPCAPPPRPAPRGGMGGGEKARAVVDGVLPGELCAALAALGRAAGCPADRPRALGAPLLGLAAARDPFLLPLVLARDLLRDAAEAALGLEGELAFEFTGLFTWLRGSGMGWHADNGRGRENREVSAVVFLNDAAAARSEGAGGSEPAGDEAGSGEVGDFSGGDFEFRGERVRPRRGRMVAFRSGESHRVEGVATGERCTLVAWFTRNAQAREDARILKLLLSPGPALPLPPEMRRGIDGAAGEDVRLARLRERGDLDRLPSGSEAELHLRVLALERGGGSVEAWRAYERCLQGAMAKALPRWEAVGELYWPDGLDPDLALLAGSTLGKVGEPG